ncbi:MAG TPA: hypothetical protein VEB21_01765, partial [Terriglobales bacterium]|nr:hypothetical protein [Terriglobales bacterium]
EQLIARTKHPQRVLREVTNAISAGIYISHDHASIYGSDVHDWADYTALSLQLPELRLPVDSFEKFCLLLDKDPTTINTALNKKTSEELVLQPFEDERFLKLQVFNDINVFFGAKGTGKSCILAAIAKYFAESGVTAEVYRPDADRFDELFDLKGKDFSINLEPYGIVHCSDEIGALRRSSEADVTGLGKYVAFFTSKSSNRNAKRILLKDLELEEELSAQQLFLDADEAASKSAAYLEFVRKSQVSQDVLGPSAFAELERLLTKLLRELRDRTWADFVAWKETCLLNSAIALFGKEVERKTGGAAKPTTTGLRSYASTRIRVAANSAAVVRNLDTAVPTHTETIGSLGANKGVLTLCTEAVLQNGRISEGDLSPLRRTKKTTIKAFARKVRSIAENPFSDDLFHHIAELNRIEDVEDIEAIGDLLLFRRYFALDGQPYEPSSGEKSMVMLQAELERDTDVYILDEPELSLGNEYISDVIVPLIRERARAGKRVFISTHDANIAVRTLPYSSIYRAHDHTGYKTYIGNPFTNKLTNTENTSDQLDWRHVSMKTLEGGRDAFGERGRIYGEG